MNPERQQDTTSEDYWSAVGDDWERGRRQRLWRTHSDAVAARLIERWFQPSASGRLLKTDTFDEAVSQGIGDVLRDRCGSLVAMDLSASTLRAARPELRAELVAADARRLPFDTGSFERVISLSTLDHFRTQEEIDTSIQELHRVLAPGGELLLTLDNPANPLIGLRGILPYAWLHRIGLVPYFVGANRGPRSLRRSLEAHGFEVIEEGAVVHSPRVLAVAIGSKVQGSPRIPRASTSASSGRSSWSG